MNRKTFSIVLVAALLQVGVLFLMGLRGNDKPYTTTELRKEFYCDRITADELATDIYCDNPDYYFQDFENGSVIGTGDFYDPRYLALFEKPNTNYNPNYADAIQLKKPELCNDIEYALQSGPTDEIIRLYNQEAKIVCLQQADMGFFGCECDSESVLNNMRVPDEQ